MESRLLQDRQTVIAFLSVIAAGFTWTIATQMFSHLGRQMSVFTLNLYKGGVSLVCFILACWATGFHLPPPLPLATLCASGIFGFAVADLFIFRAFARMGAARTLMISAFEPLMVAFFARLLIGTALPGLKLLGLIFLGLCLISLSLDKKNRVPFHWTVGLLAFFGYCLDSLGVVFSKMSFLADPALNSAHANLFRIGAAMPILFALSLARKPDAGLRLPSGKITILVIVATFFGTFLSLMLYLNGLAHLPNPAVVAGIGSLPPVYASIYEHVLARHWPSKAFFCALFFMICGVLLLVRG